MATKELHEKAKKWLLDHASKNKICCCSDPACLPKMSIELAEFIDEFRMDAGLKAAQQAVDALMGTMTQLQLEIDKAKVQ
jgi:hypothetical protein